VNNTVDPERRGPDFVIIGAMKSGTTSLFRWLNHHTGSDLCPIKETHYFSRNWNKGLPWYLDLFRDVDPEKVTGEASPSYSHPDNCEAVAERLHQTFPDVKILYVVRHPIDRMRSEFRHEVQRGREKREFDVALQSQDRPYWRRSRYWSCIEPFVERFDRQQIMVPRFEDMVADSGETWYAILEHLGLENERRHEVEANRTTGKAGFRGLTKVMYSMGFGRAERLVPPSVRKALRPLFFTESKKYFELASTCKRPVPAAIEAKIWEDIARLEGWMGRDRIWDR
jgi:hypothetical protein